MTTAGFYFTVFLLSHIAQLLIANMYLEDKNRHQKSQFCGIFLDYLSDKSFDSFKSLSITSIEIIKLEKIR